MAYEHERELAEWRGEIEARVATVEREVTGIRERHHSAMNAILQPLAADMARIRDTINREPVYIRELMERLDARAIVRDDKHEDEKHLTLREVTVWASIAGAAGAAGWFLAQIAK